MTDKKKNLFYLNRVKQIIATVARSKDPNSSGTSSGTNHLKKKNKTLWLCKRAVTGNLPFIAESLFSWQLHWMDGSKYFINLLFIFLDLQV